MFVVTWRFKGTKQSQTFASSAGADSRAKWLKRQVDCSNVKVKPKGLETAPRATATQAECWAAIDADKEQRMGCTRDCFCNCNGSCIKS